MGVSSVPALAPAFAAAFHYLALGIGLGSLFMRGVYLKQIGAEPRALTRAFSADSLWGLAALLWVGTGLLRLLHGYDKPTAWYLRNHLFWVKMGLFLLVFALEMLPMIRFMQFRMRQRRDADFTPAPALLPPLLRMNHIELALLLVIPLVAALMARGIGY